MPPQNSQAPHPGLSPDDAAANLSLATHLSTQLAAPQMPQEAENAPVEAPQTPDLAPEVEKLQKEVEGLKKQLQKDPKDDLAEIRKQVEAALAEEDPKEHGK